MHPPASKGLRRPGPLLLILSLVILAGHAALWSGLYSTDDAFISYRYAENAADGLGLVWNPGEPVEGYTNFLWTVLLSALAGLGLDLPRTAPMVGTLLALVTLPLTASLARRLGARGWTAVAAPLLALSGSTALWASSGMETPLFGLLLAAGAWALTFPNGLPAAGSLFALAALTRPEGLLFGLVGLGVAARGRRRDALLGGLLLLGPVLLHLGWRLSFYGDWLPNTFQAKSAGQPSVGLAYLGTHLLETGPLYLLGAAVLADRRRRSWSILAPIPLFLLYVVWTGGDWMPAHRFCAPLLPLLAAAAAGGAAVLGRRPWLGGAAVAICLLWTAGFGLLQLQPALSREAGPDVLRALGEHLREIAPPDSTVAVVPAGKIPYYSGLRAIDMRGLCDRHIARTEPPPGRGLPGHRKRDPDYVLARRPDYIVTTGATRKKGLPPITLDGPPILDSYPILQHPEFARLYEVVRIPLDEGEKDLLYFCRR